LKFTFEYIAFLKKGILPIEKIHFILFKNAYKETMLKKTIYWKNEIFHKLKDHKNLGIMKR